MKVREVMSQDPVCCLPGDLAQKVAEIMAQCRAGERRRMFGKSRLPVSCNVAKKSAADKFQDCCAENALRYHKELLERLGGGLENIALYVWIDELVCTRTLAGFSGTLCPRAEWSQQSESANNSERRSRFRSRWNPGSVGPQDCCPCSNAGTTCNGDTRSHALSTAGRTAAASGHRHGSAAAPGHHDRRRIAVQPIVDALYDSGGVPLV